MTNELAQDTDYIQKVITHNSWHMTLDMGHRTKDTFVCAGFEYNVWSNYWINIDKENFCLLGWWCRAMQPLEMNLLSICLSFVHLSSWGQNFRQFWLGKASRKPAQDPSQTGSRRCDGRHSSSFKWLKYQPLVCHTAYIVTTVNVPAWLLQ